MAFELSFERLILYDASCSGLIQLLGVFYHRSILSSPFLTREVGSCGSSSLTLEYRLTYRS
jgi:hypothetical protein